LVRDCGATVESGHLTTPVTQPDLRDALAEYRQGLDAELGLLAQLTALAQDQQHATGANDYRALAAVSERRDDLMRALLEVEAQLRPVRALIASHAEEARHVDGFDEVARLHREAEDLVATILTSDRSTLDALHAAELARRTASQAIEAGEATLAAYRRVIAPPLAPAGLVSRHG
jgi:hypothetical protein